MEMGREAEREAVREVWAMLKRGAAPDEATEALVESGWSNEAAHDITVRAVTSRWNWGGFLFGGIWLLGNRCWLAFGVTVVATALLFDVVWRIAESIAGEEPISAHAEDLQTATIRVLQFMFHLVVGYMGGRWSWRARKYKSLEQFRQTQNVWADFALVTMAFGAFAIIFQSLAGGLWPTLAEHFLH